MRILIAIPHFCLRSPTAQTAYGSLANGPIERGLALSRSIAAVHQHWGHQQAIIQISKRQTKPANQELFHDLRIVVLTVHSEHALGELTIPSTMFEHIETDVDPMHLGFACHRLLADRQHGFDFCGYLEDDLVVHDAWWFEKLRWFSQHAGVKCLLLPNRFEVASQRAYHKVYIDGDLAERVTSPFQNVRDQSHLTGMVLGKRITFVRPLNPHAGCFFLSAEQMRIWSSREGLGIPSDRFVGPLESAATLGVMQAFKIFKASPTNANFFEIEHHGDAFLQKIRRSKAGPV